MSRSVLCAGIALFCLAPLLSANAVEFDVVVDTSSISGITGSLDLNFNPGPLTTQSASLQILNFAGDGTLYGVPSQIGDVFGLLPGTVTFDNATGFNDYFQAFKFGSFISFDVSLYGPALASPDGTSTSGSSFAFSMFSDAAGTVPTLTSDLSNGFAFTVNVNLDGTTTLTNSSIQTAVTEIGGITATPEPDTSSMVLICLACCIASVVRKKGPRRA